MFVSFLRNVSHYCFMRWDQKFGKCIVFFSAETTIHNSQYNMCSTKLRAKDYPHAGHLGLLVVIESSIASRKHTTASIH